MWVGHMNMSLKNYVNDMNESPQCNFECGDLVISERRSEANFFATILWNEEKLTDESFVVTRLYGNEIGFVLYVSQKSEKVLLMIKGVVGWARWTKFSLISDQVT